VFIYIEKNVLFLLQVHYYVQSHIQINEYRDRVILVGISIIGVYHYSLAVFVASVLLFVLTGICL
jgi:hypothetical protein